MNELSANTTVAYGDESVRMVGNPPFYMLGVCLLENADAIDFSKLAKLMPPESRKLHWRDMSQRLQRESLNLLANIKRADVVIVASPLDDKKQERARRKRSETLLPELEAKGIGKLGSATHPTPCMACCNVDQSAVPGARLALPGSAHAGCYVISVRPRLAGSGASGGQG